MDRSREKDLYALDEQRKNPSLPMWQRQLAHGSFEKIQNQLKDRKLIALRERLARATIAGDRLEVWKITCQIKEYLKEPLIPREHME